MPESNSLKLLHPISSDELLGLIESRIRQALLSLPKLEKVTEHSNVSFRGSLEIVWQDGQADEVEVGFDVRVVRAGDVKLVGEAR